MGVSVHRRAGDDRESETEAWVASSHVASDLSRWEISVHVPLRNDWILFQAGSS